MKKHAAPIVAVILLLLPVLYVGSYLALVVPGGLLLPVVEDGKIYNVFYRFGGRKMSKFYWPLEQIDRKVRPGTWDFWNHERSGRAPILPPLSP